jgi:AraC family 4-hydroxyphenylacetate 3-monooxygenase operon regulatory protein
MVLEIKRMLAFTKMSVNDICYQTGFSDPAYFSRFFKKHSGKTALVYRKEQE